MIDRETFLEGVRRLAVYDTHEHLRPERQAVQAPPDFFDLLIPYVCDDLVSAGMALGQVRTMLDRSAPFTDRWKALSPHLDFVRGGTYFDAVRRSLPALREDEVSEQAARSISEQMRLACSEGYYKREFGRLGIVGCDVLMEDFHLAEGYDPELFRRIPTVSRFCPTCPQDIDRLSVEFGVNAGTLSGLEQSLDVLFSQYDQAGVHAIKLGSAYARRLDFGAPDRAAAQAALDRVVGGFSAGSDTRQIDPKPLCFESLVALDDLLVDSMVARAGRSGMQVHIHTGIHAWNYNDPERCHPAPLRALINRHPRTMFVLLHCGYPFEDEALLLAKYFPNVKINLAWIHIVDRVRAVALIRRIAQMIPVNKVLGFGGDYIHIENISGHLDIARENLAAAFLQLIASGDMSETRALETIARWLVAQD